MHSEDNLDAAQTIKVQASIAEIETVIYLYRNGDLQLVQLITRLARSWKLFTLAIGISLLIAGSFYFDRQHSVHATLPRT